MPITFACPVCKTSYTVNDRDAGKKSDCKVCGQRLQVPKPPQRAKTVLGEFLPASDRPDPNDPKPIDAPPAWEFTKPIDLQPADEPEPEPAPTEQPRWHDEDDYDDPPGTPGKVQAIAFMLLLGGAWAIVWAGGWVLLSGCLCLFWPGTYYSLVFGIMGIIRGAELMGSRSGRTSPRTIIIMQIIAAVSLDPVNIACGIVGMVFLNDPVVDRYFRRRER